MKINKGITLIALIITIIVLIILTGIAISMFSSSGIVSKASEATFKTRMAELEEKANLYTGWEITQTMQTDTTTINAGEILKSAIADGVIMDITEDDVSINIESVLGNITAEEKDYMVIYKGEFYYISRSGEKNNEEQKQWCEEMGINVLEYIKPTGIMIRTGKYELVKGIYLCTPKLDQGFATKKTRYMVQNTEGNMAPGKWVTDFPSEDWYDYANSMWANVYIESDGSETYYVWVPRYCFKLNQATQRSDVKFIDINNNYKDAEGNETLWADLQAQGYQVPEAFTMGGTELTGYWATKYTLGNATTPVTINYDMSAKQGKITIKNMTRNTTITDTNPITKYTVALNGKIVQTITDPTTIQNINSQVIEITNLKVGDNLVNVTGLNANGEIVGSMTKIYSPAVVNAPELASFNQDTTFYVTWDENGNEHSTVPISKEPPQFWYEYGASEWANIVTRNNDGETYYVWIPRYEFQLDQVNQKSFIKFLSGTSTTVDPGYQIPEAFTMGGIELTGYWATKYTLGNVSTAIFDTETVATSSSIRTKAITGTGLAAGQVYKYYINGDYKGESTTATNPYEYTGLTTATLYTILIEIRNSTTDEYIGTITKQVRTVEANKPDLTGFNPSVTYYITYDQDGNEVKGTNITNDGSNSPAGWYNYSNNIWANIVVEANGNVTYYTWIPRYEFMITSTQYAQPAVGRTTVRFIPGTSTDVDPGYQIPEAFTFNGVPISGYWVTKYTAGL